MFKESQPIAYDAPADLKKWPSLKNERVASKTPYMVYNGTLADCIRQLLAKPIKQISLYDIVTERQPAFDGNVLSPGDAAEIAMRKDFPKEMAVEVDAELTVRDDAGNARYARVESIEDDTVTLNFNHPLAGDELHFHVKVVALREPTDEELEHGHVHEDGHHH